MASHDTLLSKIGIKSSTVERSKFAKGGSTKSAPSKKNNSKKREKHMMGNGAGQNNPPRGAAPRPQGGNPPGGDRNPNAIYIPLPAAPRPPRPPIAFFADADDGPAGVMPPLGAPRPRANPPGGE